MLCSFDATQFKTQAMAEMEKKRLMFAKLHAAELESDEKQEKLQNQVDESSVSHVAREGKRAEEKGAEQKEEKTALPQDLIQQQEQERECLLCRSTDSQSTFGLIACVMPSSMQKAVELPFALPLSSSSSLAVKLLRPSRCAIETERQRQNVLNLVAATPIDASSSSAAASAAVPMDEDGGGERLEASPPPRSRSSSSVSSSSPAVVAPSPAASGDTSSVSEHKCALNVQSHPHVVISTCGHAVHRMQLLLCHV